MMNINHTAFKRRLSDGHVYEHTITLNDGYAIIRIILHTRKDAQGFNIISVETRTLDDNMFVDVDDNGIKEFMNKHKTLIAILKYEKDELRTDICVDAIDYILNKL